LLMQLKKLLPNNPHDRTTKKEPQKGGSFCFLTKSWL